ncbi:hypothetical protein Tco_1570551 [Tanacetum coccineum]
MSETEPIVPTSSVTALRIPIIKKGEYDLWSMKMRQYIAITDHILWDIITNGNQTTTDPASPSVSAPKTSLAANARRNNEKALNILLSAIPDRHLLSFHDAVDARSLWKAIKARFGGNEASKKMQKNLLKQQFETFTIGSREELDSAYERDYSLSIGIFVLDKMSRDVITVSTMRIPLLYRGEYSQWSERFMNYLEEQTDGETMINSIKNGEHPLPVTTEEKKTRKIDRLERSLLIQGIPNDIYSLIDSNDTAKDLWDALERQMRGSEYGKKDRKASILYEYETFRATEGEQLLDAYLCYLQVINDLKK